VKTHRSVAALLEADSSHRWPKSLAGKLFDENGEPLYVQGAARGERRYRYYVSRRLVKGKSEEAEKQWRLSAPEIERAGSAAAQTILSDRAAIALTFEESGIDSRALASALKSAQASIERLQTDGETASVLAEIIERVELSRAGIRVSLKLQLADSEDRNSLPRHLSLAKSIPMRMKRRCVATRMVLEGEISPSRVNLPLLRAVARAHRWALDLISGQVHSVEELALRPTNRHASDRMGSEIGKSRAERIREFGAICAHDSLSLGPHAKANRALTRGFRSIL
jgi:site-specific DNA recombinase